MENLISMTDFVLSKKYTAIGHENYANFLKQPLELWMFVPCDESKNIIDEPVHYETWLKLHKSEGSTIGFDEHLKHQQAKEKCLFEGFEIIDKGNFYFIEQKYSCIWYRVLKKNTKAIIENLLCFNEVKLTKTAQKQIGL